RENEVVQHDGRGDVGGVAAEFLVGPEHLAVGADADQAAVEQLYVLLHAAGSDDDAVAIDEGRFAVTPAALLAAELLLEIAMPDLLAVLVDADEVAFLSECEDEVAVDGGSAAEVASGRTDFAGPELLAVPGVEGDEVGKLAAVLLLVRLFVRRIAERVDAAVGDADGRVAAAEPLGAPFEGRPVGGPALQKAGFLR